MGFTLIIPIEPLSLPAAALLMSIESFRRKTRAPALRARLTPSPGLFALFLIAVSFTTLAQPVFTGITDDTGSSVTDQITQDTNLTIQGTATPDADVTITLVGTGVVGGTTADTSGDWSFDFTSFTLPEGVNSFTATETVMGDESDPSAAFDVTVDITTPNPQIGSPSSTFSNYDDITYTVTYELPTGGIVTLSDGDITINSTGDASATATVSGSGDTRTVTLSSLAGEGTLSISIAAGSATDAAGNVAEAAGPSETFDLHPNFSPSFTPGDDQAVEKNSGPITVLEWATDISTGFGEDTQTVTFVVSNDNNALFSVQPAIDEDGTLTFTPANDATGFAIVTVYLQDDGGTANGGDDDSSEWELYIDVMTIPFSREDMIIADRGPYVGTGTLLLVDPAGTQTILTTSLRDPYTVTADCDGHLLIADYETFSPLGTGGLYKLDRYDLTRTTISSGGDFATPFGVAYDCSDGSIYVADLDAFGEVGAIFHVDPGTGTQTTLSTGDNFYFLRGIVAHPVGSLFVSDLISPVPGSAAIIEVDMITGDQEIFASGGFLDRPAGLEFDFWTGDIIVADPGSKSIIRIDFFTGDQTLISNDAQFILPTHVGMGEDGDYWVTDGPIDADVGERRLYKVNRDTGVATIISSDGFFDQPRGIFVVP